MPLILPIAAGTVSSSNAVANAAASVVEEAIELATETEEQEELELVAGNWCQQQLDAITEEDLLKIDQLILEEFWSMEMLAVQSQLQGQFGGIIGSGPKKANNDWIMAPGVPTSKYQCATNDNHGVAPPPPPAVATPAPTPAPAAAVTKNAGPAKSKPAAPPTSTSPSRGSLNRSNSDSASSQLDRSSSESSTSTTSSTSSFFGRFRARSSTMAATAATTSLTERGQQQQQRQQEQQVAVAPLRRPFDAENTAYGLSVGNSDPEHDREITAHVAKILLSNITTARHEVLEVDKAYIPKDLVSKIALEILQLTDKDPGGARQVHITINLQRWNQKVIKITEFPITNVAPMVYLELTLFEKVAGWHKFVPEFITTAATNKNLYINENYELIKKRVMYPT